LEQGTSPQEIARIADTSVGYVYKETAIFRRDESKMVLAKSRKTAVTLKPDSKSNSSSKISRTEKVEVEVEHNPLVSAPPLDKEEVKVIFAAFQKGEKPIDVLARHGFNPEAVEIEYRRFLRLTDQDHAALVKDILNRIITVESETVDAMRASYKKKGVLENTQLMVMLSLEMNHRFESGQQNMISCIYDASCPPPEGWDRPRCLTCKAPIAEILYLENSHIARTMSDANLFCSAHSVG
jgi:hypothetical protein